MRYYWDINIIKRNLDRLKKIDLKRYNISKGYIDKIIDSTNASIEQDYLSSLEFTQSRNSTMFDILDHYYSNERYYKLIEKFEFELAKIDFLNMSYDPEDILDTRYYTHDESFSIVHDFYKNLSPEYYNYFLKLYNDRYKCVRFAKDSLQVNYMLSDGYCIFIDILNKNYILIRNQRGLEKVKTLAHESGHSIVNLMNPKAYVDRYDDYYTEIPTMFFELVFSYEVLSKLNPLENATLNQKNLSDFSRITYYLGCHKKFIDIWKNNNAKVDKVFYSLAKKDLGLKRYEVDEALTSSIADDGIYLVSYMVSLELFNIYKQDKEKALDLLNRIISSLPCDTLLMLEKYVPSYNHIKDEVEFINADLCKQLKKNM